MLDLKNDDGELDRGKVIGELNYILSHVPLAASSIRQQIINLIDHAVNQAQVDTENWCRNG